MKEYDKIDEALHPFSVLIKGLTDMALDPEEEFAFQHLKAEHIEVDIPVELEILVDENGEVTIGSAPPTQQIETTFMPVIHRMRVKITDLKKLYERSGSEE